MEYSLVHHKLYKRHYRLKEIVLAIAPYSIALSLSTFLSAGGLGLRDNVHTSAYLKISVMVHIGGLAYQHPYIHY